MLCKYVTEQPLVHHRIRSVYKAQKESRVNHKGFTDIQITDRVKGSPSLLAPI
jgi:hypothetical protein